MKKVVVSAPGKLHLSGEHAVVYGKPAVVVATSKRMYVTLENQPFDFAQGKNEISKLKIKDNYLASIIKLVENKHKTTFTDFSLEVNSDIATGVGMGSSAALAVATVGALTLWLGKSWDTKEINELSFEAEKVQHGNPSGGDNTVATFGGLLWYRKELDFLKTFWLLPFKIPKVFVPFVLIDTGRVETTKDMVIEVVGEKKKQNPQAFELLLAKIETTTRHMIQAIHDEKEADFKSAIKENERLLESIGIVSTSTRKLIRTIEKNGGVAKISGAGGVQKGSGIILAMHENPKMLVKIAKKYGYPSFQVQLGGEGVRREQVIL